MAVVSKKIALGRRVCKPALIVAHPYDDEKNRRAKEFDQQWGKIVSQFFLENDPKKLANFEGRARKIVVDAPYHADLKVISRELDQTHCG